MKALVTGANGFIGSRLVHELVTGGHEVRAAIRPGGNPAPLEPLDVELVECDVNDGAGLRAAASGCDTFFHVAGVFAYTGVDEAALERTLVAGTLTAVDAAAEAGVARMVLTSSSVTLGSSTTTAPRDESMRSGNEPGPAYFRGKAMQEEAAFTRAAERGLPLLAVCPTVTVGAGDRKLLPSNDVVARYLRDPYRISFPGGCNIVAVEDVARGHVIVAERGTPGERYVLGSENLEWSMIHRIISELCNLPGPRFTVNRTVAYVAAVAGEWAAQIAARPASMTLNEVATLGRFYWYRHDRAAALGYRPMPARAALAAAVAWVIDNHLDPQLAASIHPRREVRLARAMPA